MTEECFCKQCDDHDKMSCAHLVDLIHKEILSAQQTERERIRQKLYKHVNWKPTKENGACYCQDHCDCDLVLALDIEEVDDLLANDKESE